MSESSLKQSILNSLKEKHGDEWDRFDPAKRKDLFDEKLKRYKEWGSDRERQLDKMIERENHYSFFILAFLLGSVGGVIGNIFHEYFREYGIIYQGGVLLFVVLVILLLVLSKKFQRKKDFNEILKQMDIDRDVLLGK